VLNLGLTIVTISISCRHFNLHFLNTVNSTYKALSLQSAEFNLCYIQPTSVFRDDVISSVDQRASLTPFSTREQTHFPSAAAIFISKICYYKKIQRVLMVKYYVLRGQVLMLVGGHFSKLIDR
jgi:hypothetical protein